MKNIEHYVILGKKSYSDGWYFVAGYKSLATLKKRFNLMRDILNRESELTHSSVQHDSFILCSRDENKNILKIYDRFD